jgi:hypothetical protein
VLYSLPDAPALTLPSRPLLESWERKTHPSQLALTAYLDGLETRTAGFAGEHLALSLSVGLPAPMPITSGGHDLDNYLFPIVRRLGHQRFDAVFATKQRGTESTITIAPAVIEPLGYGAPDMSVRTTASAQTRQWKEQVYAACAAAAPAKLIEGPLAIDIHFGVSPQRNWAMLWKPAIDALGPILGMPNPLRPFQPNDDRIVSLGLHRTIHDALGYCVEVEVYISSAIAEAVPSGGLDADSG